MYWQGPRSREGGVGWGVVETEREGTWGSEGWVGGRGLGGVDLY